MFFGNGRCGSARTDTPHRRLDGLPQRRTIQWERTEAGAHVRKLIFIAVLAIAATWAAQQRGLLPPPNQQLLSEVKVRIGLISPAYFTFQQFATALVRGDMDTIDSLAQRDGTREQARQISLHVRRLVREVRTTSYRLDAEQTQPTGAVSVEVTQTMRADPMSTYSSIGVMECEGRYAATLATVGEGWKVIAFQVESVVPMPEAPALVLTPHGNRARWPCRRTRPRNPWRP